MPLGAHIVASAVKAAEWPARINPKATSGGICPSGLLLVSSPGNGGQAGQDPSPAGMPAGMRGNQRASAAVARLTPRPTAAPRDIWDGA